ncbi:hypothetical protein HD554DRAFT_2086122 [Boletus coccyginus]|nr:hypothetical protein HD554DRAFT_2086122 [Boletus coccyginus]
MAPNLTSGSFRIVSLVDGNPLASVNLTRPGVQNVILGGPVTNWVVNRDSVNTYRFRVGGYRYTGVNGDNVIASVHPEQGVEWVATYREHQDAYTISPAYHKHHGWTATGDDDDSSREIEIRILIELPALPPRYLTSQLFRFVRIYDE